LVLAAILSEGDPGAPGSVSVEGKQFEVAQVLVDSGAGSTAGGQLTAGYAACGPRAAVGPEL